MKETYEAKIELNQQDIREIIADAFGTDAEHVRLRYETLQRDGVVVVATVVKDVKPGKEKQELYFPPGVREVPFPTWDQHNVPAKPIEVTCDVPANPIEVTCDSSDYTIEDTKGAM